ncbi:MAG: hypothetical protein LBR76_04045 [Oscillospiraceae bacterium]|jgi:hypothetical protein|nr:hypothetical protein [Oscillospiraceae bacterium]
MKLVHTLLFMVRENTREQDLQLAERCLRSLEKSEHTTVVVYNQGYFTNVELTEYLQQFRLNSVVIGSAVNVGIVAGRQGCFRYIFGQLPDAEYISELHTDMIFAARWDTPLCEYLRDNAEEPMICCAIVTDAEIIERYPDGIEDYLAPYRGDRIGRGLVHPCVHRAEVLKAVGGYDTRFLPAFQAFEDDSLLVSYHYYYGTRANWFPKILYRSVVYHAIGGQRYGLGGDLYANFAGLVKQYGAMGMDVLSRVHVNPWHIQFFGDHFTSMANE